MVGSRKGPLRCLSVQAQVQGLAIGREAADLGSADSQARTQHTQGAGVLSPWGPSPAATLPLY